MKTRTYEKDEIQTKIDIVYNAIAKYEWFLENGNRKEEYLIDAKLKLEREKKELQHLKEKHAEYFI